MTIISKELENIIKNKQIIPYLSSLNEGQYLVITDANNIIKGRFMKADDIIFEIFNIYSNRTIEDYVQWLFPATFLICNIEEWETLNINIFDRKEYIKFMKNNLKEEVEKIIQLYNNGEDVYSLIKKDIEECGGNIVSFGINDKGLLAGACVSDEDTYWIYITKDFSVHLSSTVGKFSVIENPDDSFKDLLYVAQNEPESISYLINDRIEDTIDYIFTELKVRE